MSKSICFIAGGLAGGGQERALTNLANEYARLGYRITIICLFKTEVFFKVHHSINVIWPNRDRTATNKFLYAFYLIPYIRKNINTINPDTVVSFGDWYNAYTVICTRFLNKPVYITNRMGPNLHLGKFLEFFNKLTYRKATAMIVQTNRAEEIMKRKYGVKKVFVVPNAVKPIEVENRIAKKLILTVGRLSKEKGHSILIRAFSKLKNEEWELGIVGDGSERETLEKIVQELKLGDKVTFYGHRKEFSVILARASLFVLPSYYEGFPNALVEAMSVPIVCVASNCIAGPSEIIRHNVNGFLFEPGNVEELSKLLKDLINTPLYRLASIEMEAKRVTEIFNFDVVAQKFINVILNLDEGFAN